MDDGVIVDLFWQRSEEALTLCTREFGAYCRKIAMNILHNFEDAEECVNETWFKAWDAIPPARPRSLCAFLGKITRNIAINRYRAAHTQKRGGELALALEELREIPAPEVPDGEITRVISCFLRGEPTRNADIFVKRYWYLQSVREIAAETGFRESKVTSLLFRMRKRLRGNLEKEGLL